MSVSGFIARYFADYDSEHSLGFKLRKKRVERLMRMISACYETNRKVLIIDVGGTRQYWKIIPIDFLIQNNVRITIVNLPSERPFPPDDSIFTFIDGNGCNLDRIPDKSFDISHSNSVIEHVGDWNRKVMFALEIQRVAKIYYTQTPNYWFAIEPHFFTPFFHWLPKSLRISLISKMDLGQFKRAQSYDDAKRLVESCDLLSRNKMKKLFPGGLLYNERFFIFVKSIVVTNQSDDKV